ncbi:uncharacterized protein [Arachis hypogaea]|uniref:uncharacterized protein n=1 Tax=Arachis hypogaea TaxID=3818 RepID=UPI003B2195B8
MAELKAMNQEAFWYLIAIAPRYWSRSRFTFNSQVDTLVNNMSGSFNSVIVDAREKHIVTMLEETRIKLMIRWAKNRELAQNYSGTILPRIRMRLERKSRSAGEWRPYWSAAQKYEVVNRLENCIKFKGLDLEPFVADCYKKEAYLKCYESVIHPLNGPDFWQKTAHCDVMTLPYRRFSHRPVKKRRLAAGEEEQSSHTQLLRRGEKQRCSICGSVGHNKSRCPKPIKDEAQHSKKLSKGKKKKSNTNSHPPAAKGGRKTTSSQPTPKLGVKRKTTSTTQPPSSAQSNPTT